MKKKKLKTVKIIIISLLTIWGVLFFANWFLKARLERFLKSELNERVNNATDGFYNLEFDDLSVGFVNGYLSIKGLSLMPDSLTFSDWSKKDSLPSTYLKIKIDNILFDGVNLTWLFNYKKLNFKLFEVKSPTIEIYETIDSDPILESEVKNTTDKTLYEQMSPYIKELLVGEINLDNASVKYIAFQDSNKSVFSLKDINFKAYNFRLDSLSYSDGKLLYSDDFEFLANSPQRLLSDKQMLVKTSKIELSTKDSLVKIENMEILPKTKMWERKNIVAESYIKSSVKSIELKGVAFNRKNTLNDLLISTFRISGSDIEYFNNQINSVVPDSVIQQSENTPIITDWSLYSTISPIFHSLSINHIVLDDARFKYFNVGKDSVDVYDMDKLNFEAYNFKVDPNTHYHKRFLYSESFKLESGKLMATVSSRNQVFNINRIEFNSHLGFLNILGFKVSPITKYSKLDYLDGTIESLSIEGMKYSESGLLNTDRFIIRKPLLNIVVKPYKAVAVSKKEDKTNLDSYLKYLKSFGPSINSLSLREFELEDGNLAYTSYADSSAFRLRDFSFKLTNLLINENTVKNSNFYTSFDDFWFKFKNFDNLLPNKEYRLKVKQCSFEGIKNNLSLTDIELEPTAMKVNQKQGDCFYIKIPRLDVKGLNYKKFDKDRTIDLVSIIINSPVIDFLNKEDVLENSKKNQAVNFPTVLVQNIKVNNPKFRQRDSFSQDSLLFFAKKLDVNNLKLLSNGHYSIGTFNSNSANIVLNSTSKLEINKESSKTKKTDIGGLQFQVLNSDHKDLSLLVTKPNLNLKFSVKDFYLSQLLFNKKELHIGDLNIDDPNVNLYRIIADKKVADKKDKKFDVYDVLKDVSSSIVIDQFNISSGQFDVKTNLEDQTKIDKLNRVDLSFSGLVLNNKDRKYKLSDFNFETQNLHFPLDNGLYGLNVGKFRLNKDLGLVAVQDIHLKAIYPKTEFAYKDPKHKDWFDVTVGDFSLLGVDFPTFFSDNLLLVEKMNLDNVVLLNYKNSKIDIPHNKMPLINTMLFKVPFKFNIDSVDIVNFSVVYEELARKAKDAGVISFIDMNGKIANLANFKSTDSDYMTIHANGKLMGTGFFDAEWAIPNQSSIDLFTLKGHLHEFDLKDLNQLIMPMANAKVARGRLNSLTFSTKASSIGATVDMLFLYDSLAVNVFKEKKDGTVVENKFINLAAKALIKKSNPDKKRGRSGKPRQPHLKIERDPYHSTFNYFWQILAPPAVESVGFSSKDQDFTKGLMKFFTKVKNVFRKPKSKVEKKEELDEN